MPLQQQVVELELGVHAGGLHARQLDVVEVVDGDDGLDQPGCKFNSILIFGPFFGCVFECVFGSFLLLNSF